MCAFVESTYSAGIRKIVYGSSVDVLPKKMTGASNTALTMGLQVTQNRPKPSLNSSSYQAEILSQEQMISLPLSEEVFQTNFKPYVSTRKIDQIG